MIEPLRSHYLAALGIENYAPRFILPGAKASAQCEWLEPATEVVEAAPPSAALPAVEDASPLMRAPLIEAAPKPARAIEQVGSREAPAAEAGPQFALSIVLAGGGLLLIDAAPASNAERTAFQGLLNNMLPALRPAAAQYVLDTFIWPLTRQSKIPRDAGAAKETLAAYLQKQIQQRAIDTVLLLGDAAQQWCELQADGLRVVASSSLLACVQDPTRKRALWNDIRHLAEKSG